MPLTDVQLQAAAALVAVEHPGRDVRAERLPDGEGIVSVWEPGADDPWLVYGEGDLAASAEPGAR